MLNIRLLINALRYLERTTTESSPDGESDRPAPGAVRERRVQGRPAHARRLSELNPQ
jgi:hypothetical protein